VEKLNIYQFHFIYFNYGELDQGFLYIRLFNALLVLPLL
jgi:hypothetical protein